MEALRESLAKRVASGEEALAKAKRTEPAPAAPAKKAQAAKR